MEWIGYDAMVLKIAQDAGISPYKEYTLKLPASRIAIKRFVVSVAGDVRIFDGQSEHPYMLPKQRNDAMLMKGIELRRKGMKSLREIIKESGANVSSNSVQICEGGGWYSKGTRYEYKNFYTEV